MTCSAAARAPAPPPGSILRGQFTCARCGTLLSLCACGGSTYGQDVVMILPNRLPEDATPEQHMDRWANHVVMNPGACCFDAIKFVQDMKAKGIIPAFARLKPRLEAMAEHYCSSSTGVSRLLERMKQYNVEEYTREVAEAGAREAVQQFTTFDWSRMDKLGLSLVNNVYQDSDPDEYPLTDADLSLGFEVLGCLVQVNKMASEQRSYSFEPFDWQ